MTSQLHRSLVPIQVWLLYLLQGGLTLSAGAVERASVESSPYTTYFSTFMGIILMVAYVVVKGKLIYAHFTSWRLAASKLWQCTVGIYHWDKKGPFIFVALHYVCQIRICSSKWEQFLSKVDSFFSVMVRVQATRTWKPTEVACVRFVTTASRNRPCFTENTSSVKNATRHGSTENEHVQCAGHRWDMRQPFIWK